MKDKTSKPGTVSNVRLQNQIVIWHKMIVKYCDKKKFSELLKRIFSKRRNS